MAAAVVNKKVEGKTVGVRQSGLSPLFRFVYLFITTVALPQLLLLNYFLIFWSADLFPFFLFRSLVSELPPPPPLLLGELTTTISVLQFFFSIFLFLFFSHTTRTSLKSIVFTILSGTPEKREGEGDDDDTLFFPLSCPVLSCPVLRLLLSCHLFPVFTLLSSLSYSHTHTPVNFICHKLTLGELSLSVFPI